jgi:hypothetical protein
VLSFAERLAVVRACRYVGRVLDEPAPLHASAAFLDRIGADLCCHGNDMQPDELRFWYGELFDSSRLRRVRYTPGISTSQIFQRVAERCGTAELPVENRLPGLAKPTWQRADGWFATGDLAVTHPDGYVEIKDRAKDLIIPGGENISSLEVEEVLYRHPAVMEAAVVARPFGPLPKTSTGKIQKFDLRQRTRTTME